VFLKNLESLRGIAALMVALSHSLLVLTVDGIDNLWFTQLSEVAGWQSAVTRFLLIFLNGGAAVTIFFVLSGYVLGLSLDKHSMRISRALGFYAKRVFRLYPAHIAVTMAIVVSMLAFHQYQVFEAGSEWYGMWYQDPISGQKVMDNLALLHVDLNHIAWTLQVELAGSVFLPFAYLLARRVGLWINLLAVAALVWLSYSTSSILLMFLYCFYVGLILPQLQQRFETVLTGISGDALLFVGILVLCSGFTLMGSQGLFGRVLIETLGATVIISYLINGANSKSWINRFLARDVINRLGRYSYSFYLIHFIVLYWTAYILLHALSAGLLSAAPLIWGIGMAVVTVPVTFWLSGVVYRNVEVPMVGVGKRLVRD
jgi:peptidoglycan/LPS O-acetylase OafA/YrhL